MGICKCVFVGGHTPCQRTLNGVIMVTETPIKTSKVFFSNKQIVLILKALREKNQFSHV